MRRYFVDLFTQYRQGASALGGSLSLVLVSVFALAPANMQAQQGMPDLPRMVSVEAFAGPFPFTAIQKLQDPKNGVTCYLYIPVRANFIRDEQGPNYGSTSIGSISCIR